MSNLVEAWRSRRIRSRVHGEARHLITEARRILRKKSYRIPAAVSSDIETTIAELEASMGTEDLDRTRQTLGRLDESMDEHLSFARKSTAREYAESIGVAVAIALLLRAFVVEAFQIPSSSMIPTLEIGDHIFVSKFAYGLGIPFTDTKVMQFAEPKRGDVIVFKYPLGPEIDYIKRVVGLPGDRIEIRRNEIFINGNPLPREHIKGPCHYSEGSPFERSCELWVETWDGNSHNVLYDPGAPKDDLAVVVPDDHVFVMGDNRDNSNDSRKWGTVPYNLIKGRALIVWWSRDPSRGSLLSPKGIADWVGGVRPGRLFHVID